MDFNKHCCLNTYNMSFPEIKEYLARKAQEAGQWRIWKDHYPDAPEPTEMVFVDVDNASCACWAFNKRQDGQHWIRIWEPVVEPS